MGSPVASQRRVLGAAPETFSRVPFPGILSQGSVCFHAPPWRSVYSVGNPTFLVLPGAMEEDFPILLEVCARPR